MAGKTSTASQNFSVPVREAERFAQLERKLANYRPTTGLLKRAFLFAAERHANQKRKSGEPFLSHPLEVAHILANMRLDEVTLAGGLLHDTVEDTSATIDLIEREFGTEMARCVDGVTKTGRPRFQSKEERQAATIRKMLLAMSKTSE